MCALATTTRLHQITNEIGSAVAEFTVSTGTPFHDDGHKAAPSRDRQADALTLVENLYSRPPSTLVAHSRDALKSVGERFRSGEKSTIPLDAVLRETAHYGTEIESTDSDLIRAMLSIFDQLPIVDIEPVQSGRDDREPFIVDPPGRDGPGEGQERTPQDDRCSCDEVSTQEAFEGSALALVFNCIRTDPQR